MPIKISGYHISFILVTFPALQNISNHQRWYAECWNVGKCWNAHCIHVFARLAPICMLSRCLLTKFLHWSSVGGLLRVRCWLGRQFFFWGGGEVVVFKKVESTAGQH